MTGKMDPNAYDAETEALRALSVEDRIRVAESLRAFAWDLKVGVIARQHPELSAGEVLTRVRKAFGGDNT